MHSRGSRKLNTASDQANLHSSAKVSFADVNFTGVSFTGVSFTGVSLATGSPVPPGSGIVCYRNRISRHSVLPLRGALKQTPPHAALGINE
jgi:uncharacterized protein YjbI with pentapeptide repeats